LQVLKPRRCPVEKARQVLKSQRRLAEKEGKVVKIRRCPAEKAGQVCLVAKLITTFYNFPKILQVVKPGSATCHLKLLRKMSVE
jgi:hypothetical protein